MLLAPRPAFRPAGSPVYRPTRLPAWRGGPSGLLLPNRSAKLSGLGALRGDCEAIRNASAFKLGRCTVMMWIKANDPQAGSYSNAWGLIKSDNLYGNSTYIQGFCGVDGVPAERNRLTYDCGGNVISDDTTTPTGHGYMPQSLLSDGVWKHICLVKTGAVDTNTYASYLNGEVDCFGSSAPTPAEMNELRLGHDGHGGSVSGSSQFSYRCVRIWREKALTQAEVQAEMMSRTPVLDTTWSGSGSGLFRNWELNGIDDLTDTVDGVVLASSGTVETEDSGPAELAS